MEKIDFEKTIEMFFDFFLSGPGSDFGQYSMNYLVLRLNFTSFDAFEKDERKVPGPKSGLPCLDRHKNLTNRKSTKFYRDIDVKKMINFFYHEENRI